MKLYIARHGQADHNVAGVANGDPNVPSYLTDIGQQQAQALANQLTNARFEVVFVSEMLRTQETAALLNKGHNMPVIVNANLNDNRSGVEGQSVSLWEEMLHQSGDFWNTRIGDGESLMDARKRAINFLEMLKNEPYNEVLIVSSRTIIQFMHGYLRSLSLNEAAKVDIAIGTVIVETL